MPINFTYPGEQQNQNAQHMQFLKGYQVFSLDVLKRSLFLFF